jgi:hypothetical protein
MKGMGTEVTGTIFESPLARVLTTRIEGYFHLNYDATPHKMYDRRIGHFGLRN